MKLVKRKHTEYLDTFYENIWQNPDVEEAEMELSESDSKLVNEEHSQSRIHLNNTFLTAVTCNKYNIEIVCFVALIL